MQQRPAIQENLAIGSITRHHYLKKSNIINIQGYASVFGCVDNHNDIVMPGAFAKAINKSLSGAKIKLLWQHEQSKPIGIVEKLLEDKYGLYIEAAINCQTQQGKEAAALVEQGAINSLSIGFTVNDFTINNCGQRVLTDIELWEISIVTFPANQDAQLLPVVKQQIMQPEEQLIFFTFNKAHSALATLKQIYNY